MWSAPKSGRCAGRIHANKCAIIRSDTWGFQAGKHLPVDTVAHGNKLQATATAV